MPRKKKVKQVTVPELQAFLAGAIEFNPNNWLPDIGQWKRIVEMIMNLKPEEKHIMVQNNTGRPLPESIERLVDDFNLDSNMGGEESGESHSNFDERAPKNDMRIENTETLHSIADVKDEDGVISSGKKFKGKARDDSKGLGASEFA